MFGSQPIIVRGRTRHAVAVSGECSGWCWKQYVVCLFEGLFVRAGDHCILDGCSFSVFGGVVLGPPVLCFANHLSTCVLIVLGTGQRCEASRFSHMMRLHSCVDVLASFERPLWYETSWSGIVFVGNTARVTLLVCAHWDLGPAESTISLFVCLEGVSVAWPIFVICSISVAVGGVSKVIIVMRLPSVDCGRVMSESLAR